MTVQSDLKKAIAAAEVAKGAYAMAAESTEDQTAKNMYNQMKTDIDKHVAQLNGRLNYLTSNNPNNAQSSNQVCNHVNDHDHIL